jgi:hypothetical protein
MAGAKEIGNCGGWLPTGMVIVFSVENPYSAPEVLFTPVAGVLDAAERRFHRAAGAVVDEHLAVSQRQDKSIWRPLSGPYRQPPGLEGYGAVGDAAASSASLAHRSDQHL